MNILQGERSRGLGGVTQRHLWSLSNPDLPQRSAHGPQTVAAVYQVNYWGVPDPVVARFTSIRGILFLQRRRKNEIVLLKIRMFSGRVSAHEITDVIRRMRLLVWFH